MKRLFLLGFAAALTLAPANGNAADAPVKASPRCAWFGGWYSGIQGGSTTHDWLWSDRNSWARNEVDLALPSDVTGSSTGFNVGVQAGWSSQSGCTLWGLEIDWSWAGTRSSRLNTDGQPGAAADSLTVAKEVQWFGTLRAQRRHRR